MSCSKLKTEEEKCIWNVFETLYIERYVKITFNYYESKVRKGAVGVCRQLWHVW